MKSKAGKLLVQLLFVACAYSVLFARASGEEIQGGGEYFTQAIAVETISSGRKLFTDAVFSPASFWYTPIPRNVPLNPQSKHYVAEFLRQKRAYYGTVNINTTSYSSPLYIVQSGSSGSDNGNYSDHSVAGSGVQTSNVAVWDCQKKGYSDQRLAAQWQDVPIPPMAVPSKGSDSEMSVYDLTSHTLWEFWRARRTDGGWEGCWGGKIANSTQSDGIFPFPYGATATGLPFIGGQITAEELARGEIKHVIGIALVDAEAFTTHSWPALRSDGYNPNGVPDRIPEGLRFRLDPTIDVDALKIHPIAKIIAKAAQKYGFVVWDRAGAISIRAENATSYTSFGRPDSYISLFANTPSYEILKDFPWSRLQFLPMNYGKP